MNSTPGRTSRLVVVSLVLNVFLLGTVIGGAYRWATSRSGQTANETWQPQGLRAAAAELSDGRQRQLRVALQQTRQANRPLIIGARDGRLDVLHALQARPFDAAALDAALARTRTADVALRAQLEQAVVKFAADLNADERATLIVAMEQRGLMRRIEAGRK